MDIKSRGEGSGKGKKQSYKIQGERKDFKEETAEGSKIQARIEKEGKK